jgi:hypothetical protein
MRDGDVRRVGDRPWRLAACTMRDGTKSVVARARFRCGVRILVECANTCYVFYSFTTNAFLFISLPASCRVRCTYSVFTCTQVARAYVTTDARMLRNTRTADPALARYRDARGAARSDANAYTTGPVVLPNERHALGSLPLQPNQRRQEKKVKEQHGKSPAPVPVLYRERSVSRSTALVASDLLLPAPKKRASCSSCSPRVVPRSDKSGDTFFLSSTRRGDTLTGHCHRGACLSLSLCPSVYVVVRNKAVPRWA